MRHNPRDLFRKVGRRRRCSSPSSPWSSRPAARRTPRSRSPARTWSTQRDRQGHQEQDGHRQGREEPAAEGQGLRATSCRPVRGCERAAGPRRRRPMGARQRRRPDRGPVGRLLGHGGLPDAGGDGDRPDWVCAPTATSTSTPTNRWPTTASSPWSRCRTPSTRTPTAITNGRAPRGGRQPGVLGRDRGQPVRPAGHGVRAPGRRQRQPLRGQPADERRLGHHHGHRPQAVLRDHHRRLDGLRGAGCVTRGPARTR